jgi:hypothetical protein
MMQKKNIEGLTKYKKDFQMNFTIKKGKHYAKLLPIPLKESHYGFYICRIEFDSIQPKQEYYNKLIGAGCLNPRIRSERIGWRFVEYGQIEFCIYSETNYKFKFISPFRLSAIAEGNKFFIEVFIEFDQYGISVRGPLGSGLTSSNDYDELTCILPLFLCKPYHGGNPKAAQDYNFYFNKVH